MCDAEKVGGVDKKWQEIALFREAVEDCGLEDMGFVGARFTWSNKRDGTAAIAERLDRSICNKEWRDMFPNSVVRHLDFWKSDHQPLVLECLDKITHRGNGNSKNGRSFFFEEC
ncbi:hypothetical protein Dsin_016538 [Dipteronia sinensis]|uniref:Endonuclease/exonuclease/phosphatase family protein n=1 Tax=Dipteronia sinensis TaxID=43782 RepID=A0AAE0AEK2_9ROSI|nr:hypothetical protein Dsin_016538 [Dipteronia sinensis]